MATHFTSPRSQKQKREVYLPKVIWMLPRNFWNTKKKPTLKISTQWLCSFVTRRHHMVMLILGTNHFRFRIKRTHTIACFSKCYLFTQKISHQQTNAFGRGLRGETIRSVTFFCGEVETSKVCLLIEISTPEVCFGWIFNVEVVSHFNISPQLIMCIKIKTNAHLMIANY